MQFFVVRIVICELVDPPATTTPMTDHLNHTNHRCRRQQRRRPRMVTTTRRSDWSVCRQGCRQVPSTAMTEVLQTPGTVNYWQPV